MGRHGEGDKFCFTDLKISVESLKSQGNLTSSTSCNPVKTTRCLDGFWPFGPYYGWPISNFRKQRSCESQLVLTLQVLAKGLDDDKEVDACCPNRF